MDEGSEPSGGAGASRDGGESGAGERVLRIVEKLTDQLDMAAAFVVDTLAGDLLEPIVAARRGLWVAGALFLFLGVFAMAAPSMFMAYLPWILGTLFLILALGLIFLGQLAAKAEAQVRTLLEKAKTWRTVSTWAKRLL